MATEMDIGRPNPRISPCHIGRGKKGGRFEMKRIFIGFEFTKEHE